MRYRSAVAHMLQRLFHVAMAEIDRSKDAWPTTGDNRRCRQGRDGALGAGETISAIAKKYGTSRQTIMRIRDAG
jgi:hypothetical protein